MKELRLPSSWRGMSFTNKAGYLCATHQAKDYSEACSILREMRGPRKPAPAPRQKAKPTPLAWYQKD